EDEIVRERGGPLENLVFPGAPEGPPTELAQGQPAECPARHRCGATKPATHSPQRSHLAAYRSRGSQVGPKWRHRHRGPGPATATKARPEPSAPLISCHQAFGPTDEITRAPAWRNCQ